MFKISTADGGLRGAGFRWKRADGGGSLLLGFTTTPPDAAVGVAASFAMARRTAC